MEAGDEPSLPLTAAELFCPHGTRMHKHKEGTKGLSRASTYVHAVVISRCMRLRCTPRGCIVSNWTQATTSVRIIMPDINVQRRHAS